MFEIGRKYMITTAEIQPGEEETLTMAEYIIEGVDGPLVKANHGGRIFIINTHSPKFVLAKLLPS